MSDSGTGPRVVLVTMDYRSGTVLLTRSDGKEARVPLGPPRTTRSLDCAFWAPGHDGFLAVVAGQGEEIFFELPRADGTDQLEGRLVVYLDQNQWSAVTNALHDPARVPVQDRIAALRLVELVEERLVVLPSSAGHHVETAQWTDTRRRRLLALTVLRLSRGWQMRDPLQVRRDEIHDHFRRAHAGGTGLRARPVVTLVPNSLFGQWRFDPPTVTEALAPDAAFVVEGLLSAQVMMEVLLDPEPLERVPATDWAQANQQFSDWLDHQDRDRQQKRKSIDAFVLGDLAREIAEEADRSGTSAEQMSAWLRRDHGAALLPLPSAGLWREVVHERHLNKRTVWRPNDLTDMVYLACAGAYTDVVVCERAMKEPLAKGLRRLGRPTAVHRRLRDALPAIDDAVRARKTVLRGTT